MSHPDLAFFPPETKKVLERLAHRPDVFIAIVSGRSVADVKSKVGIEGQLTILHSWNNVSVRIIEITCLLMLNMKKHYTLDNEKMVLSNLDLPIAKIFDRLILIYKNVCDSALKEVTMSMLKLGCLVI